MAVICKELHELMSKSQELYSKGHLVGPEDMLVLGCCMSWEEIAAICEENFALQSFRAIEDVEEVVAFSLQTLACLSRTQGSQESSASCQGSNYARRISAKMAWCISQCILQMIAVSFSTHDSLFSNPRLRLLGLTILYLQRGLVTENWPLGVMSSTSISTSFESQLEFLLYLLCMLDCNLTADMHLQHGEVIVLALKWLESLLSDTSVYNNLLPVPGKQLGFQTVLSLLRRLSVHDQDQVRYITGKCILNVIRQTVNVMSCAESTDERLRMARWAFAIITPLGMVSAERLHDKCSSVRAIFQTAVSYSGMCLTQDDHPYGFVKAEPLTLKGSGAVIGSPVDANGYDENGGEEQDRGEGRTVLSSVDNIGDKQDRIVALGMSIIKEIPESDATDSGSSSAQNVKSPAQPCLSEYSPRYALLRLPLSSTFKGHQFELSLESFGQSTSQYLESCDWIQAVIHTHHPHPGPVVHDLAMNTNDYPEAVVHKDLIPEEIFDQERKLRRKTASRMQNDRALLNRLLKKTLIDGHFCHDWALMDAAKYLIRTNLKSPCGGPLKTLQHLDRVLIELVQNTQTGKLSQMSKQNISSSRQIEPPTCVDSDCRTVLEGHVPPSRGALAHFKGSHANDSQESRTTFQERISLRKLIDVMDSIEKLICSASRGSLFIPEAEKSSSLFFRANEKTCSTFFNRIRLKLMNASIVSNSPVDVLNHGLRCMKFLEESMDMKNTRATLSSSPERILRGESDWPPPLPVSTSKECQEKSRPSLEIETSATASSESLKDKKCNAEVGTSSFDFISILQLQEVVFNVCRAYCELQDPDALVGVYHWAASKELPCLSADRKAGTPSDAVPCYPDTISETGESDMDYTFLCAIPWVVGMLCQAKGNYEQAVAVYCKLLRNRCLDSMSRVKSLPLVSFIDIRAIVCGITECYVALGDWENMNAFIKELAHFEESYSSTFFHPLLRRSGHSPLIGPSFRCPHDASSLKALELFDELMTDDREMPTVVALIELKEALLSSLTKTITTVDKGRYVFSSAQAGDDPKPQLFEGASDETEKLCILGTLDLLSSNGTIETQEYSAVGHLEEATASLASWDAFEVAAILLQDSIYTVGSSDKPATERFGICLKLQEVTAMRENSPLVFQTLLDCNPNEQSLMNASDMNRVIRAQKLLKLRNYRRKVDDSPSKLTHCHDHLLEFVHQSCKQNNFLLAERLLAKFHNAMNFQNTANAFNIHCLRALYEQSILHESMGSIKQAVPPLIELHSKLASLYSSQTNFDKKIATDAMKLHATCLLRLSKLLGKSEPCSPLDEFSDDESENVEEVNLSLRAQEFCLRHSTKATPMDPQVWYQYACWLCSRAEELKSPKTSVSRSENHATIEIKLSHKLDKPSAQPQNLQSIAKVLSRVPIQTLGQDRLLVERLLVSVNDAIKAVFCSRNESPGETPEHMGDFDFDTFSASLEDITSGLRPLVASNVLEALEEHKYQDDKSRQIAEEHRDQIVQYLVDFTAQQALKSLSLYEKAVDCYFRALQSFQALDNFGQAHASVVHQVNVPLALLKLLTGLGSDLRRSFYTGIIQTPPSSWRLIIPQLFSRICHANSVVRQLIRTIITLLGTSRPNDVVFPLAVGITSAKEQGNLTRRAQLFMIMNDVFVSCSPTGFGGPQKIVDETSVMVKHDVEAERTTVTQVLTQVQHFLQELNRIANLWEDLWLTVLRQVQSDMPTRVKLLEEEISLIVGPDAISEEFTAFSTPQKDQILSRYQLVMGPVIEQLRTLHSRTCIQSPQTPHEVGFQRKYSSLLSELLQSFLNPTSPNKPRELFKSFDKLKDTFSSLSRIDLHAVSPYLSRWNVRSDIQGETPNVLITGIRAGQTVPVAPQAFHRFINILRTKTRPKKLSILGQDGHMYTYLLKSREDLHLDESIMQFLDVTNCLLKESGKRNISNLAARTYPVLPLSDQSGLICWVDHVTPLFDLYKTWQQRAKDTKSVTQSPMDQYHHKVSQYLQEAGLSIKTPRKEWPKAITLRVFKEVAAMIPRDLLSHELWFTSESPSDWWRKTRTFAASVAVMSVCGYILGLGDRHLGNILANFQSGEIMHIDYNICFDRGLRLPVPEIVPFRLTQTMVHAFGPTGVHGIFRESCRRVAKVLRKQSGTLVSLLSSFVHNPLVDWIPTERKPGSRRKFNLDGQMSLNLLKFRLQKKWRLYSRISSVYASLLPKLDAYMKSLKDVHNRWNFEDDPHSNIIQSDDLQMLYQGQQLLESSQEDIQICGQRVEELKSAIDSIRQQKNANEKLLQHNHSQADQALSVCQAVLGRHQLIPNMISNIVTPLLIKLAFSREQINEKAALSSIFSRQSEAHTQFTNGCFHLQNILSVLPGAVALSIHLEQMQSQFIIAEGSTNATVCSQLDVHMDHLQWHMRVHTFEVLKLLCFYRMIMLPDNDGTSFEPYMQGSLAYIWASNLNKCKDGTLNNIEQLFSGNSVEVNKQSKKTDSKMKKAKDIFETRQRNLTQSLTVLYRLISNPLTDLSSTKHSGKAPSFGPKEISGVQQLPQEPLTDTAAVDIEDPIIIARLATCLASSSPLETESRVALQSYLSDRDRKLDRLHTALDSISQVWNQPPEESHTLCMTKVLILTHTDSDFISVIQTYQDKHFRAGLRTIFSTSSFETLCKRKSQGYCGEHIANLAVLTLAAELSGQVKEIELKGKHRCELGLSGLTDAGENITMRDHDNSRRQRSRNVKYPQSQTKKNALEGRESRPTKEDITIVPGNVLKHLSATLHSFAETMNVTRLRLCYSASLTANEVNDRSPTLHPDTVRLYSTPLLTVLQIS